MLTTYRPFLLFLLICAGGLADAFEIVRYYFDAQTYSERPVACYVEYIADDEDYLSFTLYDNDNNTELTRLDSFSVERVGESTFIEIPFNLHIFSGRFSVTKTRSW